MSGRRMGRHPDPERLHQFADGSLDPATVERISGHLDHCWACAERLREIDAVRAGAHDLRGPAEPRRDLWPQIERRVHALGPPGHAEPNEPRLRLVRTRPPRGRLAAVRSSRWVVAAGLLITTALALAVLAREPADRGTRDATPTSTTADVLENRYGPELSRLARLVETRSTEMGLQIATASQTDRDAFRTARRELREAVESASEPGPLLTELEETYRREQRYLTRLVEVASR